MLLDQTKLPFEISWVSCHDAADVAQAINRMIVRGAPAIGVSAAFGMALEAGKWKEGSANLFYDSMMEASELLFRSRPTAINLHWALERMKKTINRDIEPAVQASELELLALAMEEEDIRINHSIGAHGHVLIKDGSGILTHCNAGALATADYGTALGVIRSAHSSGKRIHVYADETRPYLQGARLTVWELAQDHIPVTLQCDNMAGWLMANKKIDLVIVGADRIALNGDTANKIGTYSLAVLAQYHQIPFYIAAPLSTIDRSIPDGSYIPIEERPASELTQIKGIPIAPEGIHVYNPAFDVTPANLITAIITEKGIIRHPDQEKITSLFDVDGK